MNITLEEFCEIIEENFEVKFITNRNERFSCRLCTCDETDGRVTKAAVGFGSSVDDACINLVDMIKGKRIKNAQGQVFKVPETLVYRRSCGGSLMA